VYSGKMNAALSALRTGLVLTAVHFRAVSRCGDRAFQALGTRGVADHANPFQDIDPIDLWRRIERLRSGPVWTPATRVRSGSCSGGSPWILRPALLLRTPLIQV
jgi:hypothetical protein